MFAFALATVTASVAAPAAGASAKPAPPAANAVGACQPRAGRLIPGQPTYLIDPWGYRGGIPHWKTFQAIFKDGSWVDQTFPVALCPDGEALSLDAKLTPGQLSTGTSRHPGR